MADSQSRLREDNSAFYFDKNRKKIRSRRVRGCTVDREAGTDGVWQAGYWVPAVSLLTFLFQGTGSVENAWSAGDIIQGCPIGRCVHGAKNEK